MLFRSVADFQKKHYRQREWVPYVLEGTTNPEQAFENWMQRDILFAQMVRKEAMKLGYSSLMTDGRQSEKQTAEEIARIFKLSNINRIDIKGEKLMIKITFPDGAVREFEPGVTTFGIAQSISNSLAKKALAGKFNGKLIDTTRAIDRDRKSVV